LKDVLDLELGVGGCSGAGDGNALLGEVEADDVTTRAAEGDVVGEHTVAAAEVEDRAPGRDVSLDTRDICVPVAEPAEEAPQAVAGVGAEEPTASLGAWDEAVRDRRLPISDCRFQPDHL